MRFERGRILLFPLALFAVATGLLVYGYDRNGFWFGALAVFLLWWADDDRKQSVAKQREEQLVAEHAPELVGKDFVQASAYIVDAMDKFKANANPITQQFFHDALAKHQAEWTRRGVPMPLWATLSLLRQTEAGSKDTTPEIQ